MSETVTEIEAANERAVATSVSRPDSSPEPFVTLIEPRAGWKLVNVRELWQFRELLWTLTLRDIKVRYKQTALGAAWAILQPFMMMLVFTVFLGRLARVPSGDTPYPLFAYAGLLPWSFFATAVANAGNSVVGSERLITKIYFPRLAIPFSAVGAAVVDFCVAFLMLVGMMIWYQVPPSWSILLVPVLLALLVITAAGIGTLLAALNVYYRDFRYVIPFMLQLWMFATPTVYMATRTEKATADTVAVEESKSVEQSTSSTAPAEGKPVRSSPSRTDAVPEIVRDILKLNPLTEIIGVFRAAVLGQPLTAADLIYPAAGAILAFACGCIYFRRAEDSFADLI